MIHIRSTMAIAALILTAAVATAADPISPASCCDKGCDKACDNVCVRVPEIKKVTKRVYTDVCEPLCLPKCSILGHLFGHKDCEDCGACGECSQWKKKTLVVKLRVCETPGTKCVAQPACAPCLPVVPAK
jgi:hypothetical protein